MPITVAVAVASLIALVVHSVYLRRVWLNRQEQRRSKVNGNRRRIANALFNMEATRLAINLCWAVGTIGLLSSHREIGYALVLPQILSVISSAFALRGLR